MIFLKCYGMANTTRRNPWLKHDTALVYSQRLHQLNQASRFKVSWARCCIMRRPLHTLERMLSFIALYSEFRESPYPVKDRCPQPLWSYLQNSLKITPLLCKYWHAPNANWIGFWLIYSNFRAYRYGHIIIWIHTRIHTAHLHRLD